ncbi:unnamed protein product [Linum trigynum]|uniref:Uncharacterized protein n=1 Tax=Linum trigynum TaxID=586398 RepID=A0AAV2D0Q8_9ROSI
MEEVWGEDWMEFKPERWVADRSEGNCILNNDDDGVVKKKLSTIHVPSYKFATFITAPRACSGKKIAYTQMKNIASCLLHRYKIDVVDDHPCVPLLSMMMFMRYGSKVRVSCKTPESSNTSPLYV